MICIRLIKPILCLCTVKSQDEPIWPKINEIDRPSRCIRFWFFEDKDKYWDVATWGEGFRFVTYSALKPLTWRILICFTIVLFPDSPAPETHIGRSVNWLLSQKNTNHVCSFPVLWPKQHTFTSILHLTHKHFIYADRSFIWKKRKRKETWVQGQCFTVTAKTINWITPPTTALPIQDETFWDVMTALHFFMEV